MRALPSHARFYSVQQLCQSIDSDIWFLTETHQALTPHHGYYSHFTGTPDRESEPGEKWSAIWSKWPIEPLEGSVSDPARSVAGRIKESEFGELILYGTVLPWNTDPRAKEVGSFAVFAQAIEIHKSDWLKIKQDFPKATLIVAGDFNQSLVENHHYGSKEKRVILENALRDGDLLVLTGGPNDPINRDSSPRANIDHICIASALEWSIKKTQRWPDLAVPDKKLSDHFLVTTHLGLQESHFRCHAADQA